MGEFAEILFKLPVTLLFLIFFLRLMGRKELQQSTPIDLVFLLLLGNIASDVLFEPKYNVIHIFVAMLLLTACVYLFEWMSWRFPNVESFFVGEPKIVIRNGKWDEDVLKKERLTEKELESKLRTKGIFDVRDVEVGILEVSGELTVKKKGD